MTRFVQKGLSEDSVFVQESNPIYSLYRFPFMVHVTRASFLRRSVYLQLLRVGLYFASIPDAYQRD